MWENELELGRVRGLDGKEGCSAGVLYRYCAIENTQVKALEQSIIWPFGLQIEGVACVAAQPRQGRKFWHDVRI